MAQPPSAGDRKDHRRRSALLGVGPDTWFGRTLRGFFDYDIEANRDHALDIFSAGPQYRW